MLSDDATALVLTYNERENIARSIGALRWIAEILIVDSFSTDDTADVARAVHPNVRVIQRGFDSFAAQCNFGLTQITSPWVLSIDADYIVPEGLSQEIQSLEPGPAVAGYSARFRYCIEGVPLRKTILPTRTILYRRASATYHNEGHGHRVRIGGTTRELSGYVLHDDRKPLRRWLQSQISYAEIEARHLLAARNSELKPQDRARKLIVPAPFLVFGYTLVGQMLILDGWRGWFYVLQRVFAEILLSLHLLEAKLTGNRDGRDTKRARG